MNNISLLSKMRSKKLLKTWHEPQTCWILSLQSSKLTPTKLLNCSIAHQLQSVLFCLRPVLFTDVRGVYFFCLDPLYIWCVGCHGNRQVALNRFEMFRSSPSLCMCVTDSCGLATLKANLKGWFKFMNKPFSEKHTQLKASPVCPSSSCKRAVT